MYRALFPNIRLASGIKPRGFTEVYCPLHNDSNPSAGMDFNTGILNCYKCGTFSPVALYSKLNGVDPPVAAALIENLIPQPDIFVDFSKKLKVLSEDWRIIYEESINNLTPNDPVVIEYLFRKGISFETLKKARVGLIRSIDSPFGNGLSALVMAYSNGGIHYGLKFRDGVGNKTCSRECSYMPWGVDDIKDNSSLIIVEGETDRLTAMELFPTSSVISTPTCEWKKEWNRYCLGLPRKIAIPQSDEASQKFVKSLQEAFNKDIEILSLPWKRSQLGKDLTEWRHQNDPSIFIERVERISEPLLLTNLYFEDLVPEVVVSQLINAGDLVVIGGPPKAGKTWLMFSLIRSLLSDEPFLGIHDWISCRQNKILFIEEEGSKKDLIDRKEKCLDGIDINSNNMFWMHRKGFKIDNPEWISTLIEIIDKNNINTLLLDCYAKMHLSDEDSNTYSRSILDILRGLQIRFPSLTIVVIHHFGKNKGLESSWEAFRGASALAGEADLGIFCVRYKSDQMKIKIDGRSVPGTAEALITNKVGIIKCEETQVTTKSSLQEFLKYMEEVIEIELKEAAKVFKVSTQTIHNWTAKCGDKILKINPANGRPAKLLFNYGKEDS